MLDKVKNYIKTGNLTRKIYTKMSSLVREQVALTNPFGKDRGKPVYIIRRYDSAGFFSNFMFVFGHIIFAEKHDYIPVVDMEHYPTPYSEKSAINGTRNGWEYYFEQPTDLSLRQAYQTRSVILSSGKMLFDEVPYYGLTDSRFPDPQLVEQLTPYVEKYISFKPELLHEAENMIQRWGGNLLGVHIRGTDMKNTPGHPMPPTVAMYIEVIDEVIDQYGKILLCTDEADILKQMQSRYGERVVFTTAYRSEDGKSIHMGSANETDIRKQHRYLNGKEVVMDTLLLSKCSAIICGHSNVSYTAILLNGNQFDFVRLLENANKNEKE